MSVHSNGSYYTGSAYSLDISIDESVAFISDWLADAPTEDLPGLHREALREMTSWSIAPLALSRYAGLLCRKRVRSRREAKYEIGKSMYKLRLLEQSISCLQARARSDSDLSQVSHRVWRSTKSALLSFSHSPSDVNQMLVSRAEDRGTFVLQAVETIMNARSYTESPLGASVSREIVEELSSRIRKIEDSCEMSDVTALQEYLQQIRPMSLVLRGQGPNTSTGTSRRQEEHTHTSASSDYERSLAFSRECSNTCFDLD